MMDASVLYAQSSYDKDMKRNTMKSFNSLLNIVMGSFFGVFISVTIMNYREYKMFPQIYEVRSAPWYCYGALTSFVIFVAVAVICIAIKLIINRMSHGKMKEVKHDCDN